MPASEIYRRLDPEFVARAHKFCFERHPVDKCISHFSLMQGSAYHHDERNPRTWSEYVARGDFPIDTHRYCDAQGQLLVDAIYRYEQIEDGLRDVSEKTSLPYRPLGVRAKAGFRLPVRPTAAERATIMAAFADSNRLTGYTDIEDRETP